MDKDQPGIDIEPGDADKQGCHRNKAADAEPGRQVNQSGEDHQQPDDHKADAAHALAWLGLGADEALETVTEVTIYLPAHADTTAQVQYTTRAADGTETEHAAAVSELYTGPAEDGGQWLQIAEQDPVVGDSIRLVCTT